MESFIDQGVPFVEDLFTTGEVPQGCGHVPRTIHQGIRSTAADFVTKREKQHDNLTILTGSTVDKVLFEHEGGTLRATGVQVVDKTGAKIITAKREVIVSGGTYCTPAILLRSGIGAKEELEKLGIECKINLPGVGKNLMDHVVSPPYHHAHH
jgi:choline dehydrogenase-like flavoprotein